VALILALAHLLVVLLIFLTAAACGQRMLELLGFTVESRLEVVLFSVGFSFAVLEILLFILSAAGWLKLSTAVGLLLVMAVSAGHGWLLFWKSLRALWTGLLASLALIRERAIALILLGFLAVGALMAMAPLTGSDAMNYHFTAPLLEQGRPLAPVFWLVPSFFLGQAHFFISWGLALGSDRVALGLIYLAGVLTAAALFAISRRLMSNLWAWIATLVFVATPLVFWQMSTSGSPDIWMAFYVTTSALAAARGAASGERWFILAGFFAGAAAGVKYTGWIIPLSLVVYVLFAQRSWKPAFLSGAAALFAGVWPLMRNWVWTGDPVFPFLTTWLAPNRLNYYSLAWISAETGAATAVRDLRHVLAFPFVMVLHGADHGFGQYFGPLVLAFAPLLLFVEWKRPAARVAGVLWAVMFFSNVFSSQMGRFLLPVYALSLALAFSGVANIGIRRWRMVGAACTATIIVFLVFAGFSDALYSRDFLPVVFGIERENAFLERTAPDYRTAEFVNLTLSAETRQPFDCNVMVFFRHLYYLRVPYVDGSPEYSWLTNPAAYDDPEKLFAHLRDMNVCWVLKAPDYPAVLNAKFSSLEQQGKLVPIASTDVVNLTGTGRTFGQRQKIHVVLLRVQRRARDD